MIVNPEFKDPSVLNVLDLLLEACADIREAVIAKIEFFLRQGVVVRLNARHGEIAHKLRDLLWHEVAAIRASAISALEGVADQDIRTRDRIGSLLEDDDENVRWQAITALVRFAPTDERVTSSIHRAISEPSARSASAFIGIAKPLLRGNEALRRRILVKIGSEDHIDVRNAVTALSDLVDITEVRTTILSKTAVDSDEVRASAVNALAPLAATDAEVRDRLLRLMSDDPSGQVRAASVRALGAAADDPSIRARIIAYSDDGEASVRGAVLHSVERFVEREAGVRKLFMEKLNDPGPSVRACAVEGLNVCNSQDSDFRQRLCVHLSADTQETGWSRFRLIYRFAELIQQDTEFLRQITTLLSSPDWRYRKSAAEIIQHAGKNAIEFAQPQLLKAVDDTRGGDSWPTRIRAAVVLLNHYKYSSVSTETLMEALDYGLHPLAPKNKSVEIRRQAAIALGKLKAEFHDPRVSDRLQRVMKEESEPTVLDGAYEALLSLVSAPPLQ